MALFKEIYCADCGAKTKMLFRTKLQDGQYLCSKCMKKVPYYMISTFDSSYTLEDYNAFKDYIDYSETNLRPVFNETHSFHDVHIDAENKIFYIGSYGISKETIFLRFANLADFDMLFQPEEFKEGIIGSKVTGDILLSVSMTQPYFQYETKMVLGAKAKAKKAFFGNKIKYENPRGMDEFIEAFATTWSAAIEEASQQYYSYTQSEPVVNSTPSELQQAMALFMIDDLDDVTLSSLKLHRNRLMQTFHPDTGSADDTKYAQKINNAYEVLKKTLSEAQQ